MNTTRTTLIERVKDPNDTLAWGEFYELYAHLIYRYARRLGLNDTDADELVGGCMEILPRRMGDFTYDRAKSKFRTYLHSLVKKEVAALYRKKKPVQADSPELLDSQTDPQTSDEAWDKQWQISHLLYCWKHIEKQLKPLHADVFRRCFFEEQPPQTVAEDLGITSNLIYQIKWKVTQDIKKFSNELLGEEV